MMRMTTSRNWAGRRLTFLYCTFEGPQTEMFEVIYAECIELYLAQKSVIDMMLKPNKNPKREDVGAQELIGKLWCMFARVFVCVCALTCVCLCIFNFRESGRLKMSTSAVCWLVVVSVLLGQRGPGLLHFFSLFSTSVAASVTYGRINNNAKLLAQVCHFVWKERATKEFWYDI